MIGIGCVSQGACTLDVPQQEGEGKVDVLESVGEEAQAPHEHVDIRLPDVGAGGEVLGDVRRGRGVEAADQAIEHAALEAFALGLGEAVLLVDGHPDAGGVEASVARVALGIGLEVDVAVCSIDRESASTRCSRWLPTTHWPPTTYLRHQNRATDASPCRDAVCPRRWHMPRDQSP